MSRGLQLDRRPYTGRDAAGDNRFNVSIKARMRVLDNSYLFTGSLVAGAKVREDVAEKLYSISSRLQAGELTLDQAVRSIDQLYKQVVEIRASKRQPVLNSKIIIPGSSVKGAIRSRVEYKLAPKLSCYSVIGAAMPPAKFYQRHITFWGKDILQDINYRRTCSVERDGRVCLVCDLFGSHSLASRVFFSDAILERGDITALGDLGITAVRPGSTFTLRIDGFSFSWIDLGLLFLGMEIFSGSPIIMGAYKYRFNPRVGSAYRGRFYFGLVKFEITGVQEFLTSRLAGLSIGDIISRARDELSRSYGGDIDWNRGVLT